jgi:hypothetical protein
MGLEDIVSKGRDSPYSSGRSRDWIKSKNPNVPAVKREEEEDWSHKRCGNGEENPNLVGLKIKGLYPQAATLECQERSLSGCSKS